MRIRKFEKIKKKFRDLEQRFPRNDLKYLTFSRVVFTTLPVAHWRLLSAFVLGANLACADNQRPMQINNRQPSRRYSIPFEYEFDRTQPTSKNIVPDSRDHLQWLKRTFLINVLTFLSAIISYTVDYTRPEVQNEFKKYYIS